MSRRILTAAASVATLVAGLSTTDAGASPIDTSTRAVRSDAVRGVAGPTVVAVGDIACAPGDSKHPCQQARTAALAKSYSPKYVLGLGDLQYEVGSLHAFRNSYDESWGALKSITKPVPGNHEYYTGGASGYYAYFRNQQPGPPGYYAFDVGTWRIYALNSNCAKISCRRQVRWLEANMKNHRRRCSAIMLHHPRFSSGGEHGSSVVARRFWEVAHQQHADLALSGHDHDYERFRRLTPSGKPSENGILGFVSGAGGKSLYRFGNVVRGSVARDNHTSGVLALSLGRGRFGFEYRTIDGKVVDYGARSCR
ncbi:MAG: hypothetical protein AVDCRST_MAG72-1291 [uncultured Nocardioidaceae bacterium]|uniref:Calcineurin-like phosphoesterase domain-containing protein n=1 Tax=uncultured Nocardioidaceae bacterium TaxID=253824 RepID=A0A6J4M378_9ACTN|nr:MAG: hypothetical protein AVDCRST_MAG72-1291 [uncultured Nocardioidaceae bacterium]